jgi:hypothetical protein
VVPGEDAADWEAHRTAIVQDLAPVGALEEALADRVALGLWRLHRVAAYEAAAAADALARKEDKVRRDTEEGIRDSLMRSREWAQPDPVRLALAEKELDEARRTVSCNTEAGVFLEQLPELAEDAAVRGELAEWCFLGDFPNALGEDDTIPDGEGADFLAAVGVPEEAHSDSYEWTGWTAGMIRRGMALFAKAGRMTPDKFLARTRAEVIGDRDKAAAKVPSLAATVKDLRRRVKVREERRVSLARLPDEAALDNVLRYEAHAGRQLTTALHDLERLQAARVGKHVTPPAVLDVTIEGGNTLPALASGV